FPTLLLDSSLHLTPPILLPVAVEKQNDQILENCLDICWILGQFYQCHSFCTSFNFTASASSLATESNKDKDFTASFGNYFRCERRRQILLPFPLDS
ncbi:MAG: hypothetical protein ACKO90_11915, partial [Microcystis panniformis]